MTTSAKGAAPAGATDEQSASHAVQSMFNSIAPRYDLLNHVLSANVDRLWWRRTARTFHHILQKPDAAILDLCCGTGDMTLALLRHRPANSKPIVAVDFACAMLERAERKFSAVRSLAPRPTVVEADALHMPFADNSFDLVTTAFGFRNLANYAAGLAEIRRILRPGGEIGILDFNEPRGAVGKVYQVYFRKILPRIGKALATRTADLGSSAPYSYLPQSVRGFPPPDEMLSAIASAGYRGATWTSYSFGIAGLYCAVKA
jgi:demethylmenaquinone methyltransferase / 2-methoxy-6-polyprenyl-1,4-benzoquinol methylase